MSKHRRRQKRRARRGVERALREYGVRIAPLWAALYEQVVPK